MNLTTGIAQAFGELVHRKLRTFLTLLGMIFGVGAVIAMLSIGEGAEREALQLIDTMGLRNVIVKAKEIDEERLKEVREVSNGLTRRDLEAALDTLPFFERHAAIKKVHVYSLFSTAGKSDADVSGVSPSHFEMASLPLRSGRPLVALDDHTYAQVCVIGSRVGRDLFGEDNPVGRRVKVNHVWLTVVGVLADRQLSRGEFEGVKLSGVQNRVYLPVSTLLKKFRFRPLEEELDELHLQVRPDFPVGQAAAALSRLLETRHRGADDFSLVVPEALLQQHRQTQRIFTIVMSCIAGISLLVGGIGIMNIMLANVLERTREIGVRRSLGARHRDIRSQFLIEAFTISLTGGIAGILVGFGLAALISLYSDWPFAWSAAPPLVAVIVCAAVGLIFGIYPAVNASRLDPVQALGRE